ncbi:hypothetical protein JRO89_XS13G0057000 [Xanthoceras sorbifolium]|uniref:Uncharacterized protein n=1 Tax=Xanthoceras sorbifolium TaxID=99658 RepID=A0ABQ8H6T7_9ROSI|nr:hypothetical protein JRO89_XS13G0057000 [Xanthoceras sorbifolium]
MRDHALTMDLSSLSEPPHNSNDANLLKSTPPINHLAQFASTTNAAKKAIAGFEQGWWQTGMVALAHLSMEEDAVEEGVVINAQPHDTSSMSSHPEFSVAEDAKLTDEKGDAPDAPAKGAQLLPGSSHKNGKRHKKNSQKIEELRKVVTPMAEIHMNRNLAESNSKVSQQPEFTQDCQMNETAGYVPKVVIPLIGDLCNVKRDTQEGFRKPSIILKVIISQSYYGSQGSYPMPQAATKIESAGPSATTGAGQLYPASDEVTALPG